MGTYSSKNGDKSLKVPPIWTSSKVSPKKTSMKNQSNATQSNKTTISSKRIIIDNSDKVSMRNQTERLTNLLRGGKTDIVTTTKVEAKALPTLNLKPQGMKRLETFVYYPEIKVNNEDPFGSPRKQENSPNKSPRKASSLGDNAQRRHSQAMKRLSITLENCHAEKMQKKAIECENNLDNEEDSDKLTTSSPNVLNSGRKNSPLPRKSSNAMKRLSLSLEISHAERIRKRSSLKELTSTSNDSNKSIHSAQNNQDLRIQDF